MNAALLISLPGRYVGEGMEEGEFDEAKRTVDTLFGRSGGWGEEYCWELDESEEYQC